MGLKQWEKKSVVLGNAAIQTLSTSSTSPACATSFNKLLSKEYILSSWEQSKLTLLLPKCISHQLWELL